MPACQDCGGTVIEYDNASGSGFCVKCGTVVEENTIVNEVSFGETSGGAAMVQGSYVAQGATHARMGGPFGNRGNSESREQTIANATKKIQSVANILRLSDMVCLAATRMYTLAVEHKFTKGRKSMNVVAVCLYVACRQKETRNYMLIDFSDLLQVNVFELGHTYLQLVQTLNLRLPLVDPSHYISRFAALLEFGDETHAVANDAVRLVQRFDRDWMTRGRRPAGICGAALLLAARMNNFRRSVEEIVQVVKIADTTLKKRLEEFKNTPSGSLTLADFRSVWLEDEVDPPAFTKGKEKEEAAREEAEAAALAEAQGEDGDVDVDIKGKGKGKAKLKKQKKGKGKRKRVDSSDEDADNEAEPTIPPPPIPLDPALLNEGILEGTFERMTEEDEDVDMHIDPALRTPATLNTSAAAVPPSPPPQEPTPLPPTSELEDTVSTALTDEVSTFLSNTQGALLSTALDEAEQRRLAQLTVVDELLGLDEAELDRFILTDAEVKIKERVWVELNKDYLEALAAKGDQPESSSKSRKRKKQNNDPRDSSSAHGSTAAESVKSLLKKNSKYSKRINYDALKDLFVDGSGPGEKGPGIPFPEDKDDDDMFTMDDKSDGEQMSVVIIEEESSLPVAPPTPSASSKAKIIPGTGEEDDEDSDKEDPEPWDDGYQQEI